MKKFITPDISFIEVKDADIIATSGELGIFTEEVDENDIQARESSWWD